VYRSYCGLLVNQSINHPINQLTFHLENRPESTATPLIINQSLLVSAPPLAAAHARTSSPSRFSSSPHACSEAHTSFWSVGKYATSKQQCLVVRSLSSAEAGGESK
jgi:hypothetical protein